MHIEKFMNHGLEYIRLASTVNVRNAQGKFKAKKNVIFNIGYLRDFDDGKPDYLARLRKSFKNGKPLIESLMPYVENKTVPEKVTLTFVKGDLDCIGEPKLVSHLLIEKYIDELGLTNWIKVRKHLGRMKYDLAGFIKLLVCGRILTPASKAATFLQNEDYYDQILEKDSSLHNIYDTLDFIWERRDGIISTMHRAMVSKFGRTTSLLFYDVTNFFFETEKADDDELDENEEIIRKGLRKRGVSKEERMLPIVQVGLFMDEQGVPVGLSIFPGNTLDHQTVAESCKRIVDKLDTDRFVFVGDRGMNSGPGIIHLVESGNGYLISRSVNKVTQEMKEWILDENGYSHLSADFRVKSKEEEREVKDSKSGKSFKVNEKNVVYWSRDFYNRQAHERKTFLDFLAKLSKKPGNFRITATQYKTIRKYLGNEVVNIKTGELINASTIKPLIDIAKVREEDALMGYYLITTSETTLSDMEVIDKYHELSRIEDQFRVMKGTLETRPMFVRTEEHVYAHLLCCMIALVVIRLIQRKIRQLDKPKESVAKKKKLWEMGLPADRIQSALSNWMVENLPDDYFRFCNVRNDDLKLILKAHGIKIEEELIRRRNLRELKGKITVI